MSIPMRRLRGKFAVVVLAAVAAQATSVAAQRPARYFPPAGKWERKAPGEVGMDPVKLKEAVDFALSRASTWDFEKDQVSTFGTPLGPVPKTRAGTNGI